MTWQNMTMKGINGEYRIVLFLIHVLFFVSMKLDVSFVYSPPNKVKRREQKRKAYQWI